jgi:hypothetical protein
MENLGVQRPPVVSPEYVKGAPGIADKYGATVGREGEGSSLAPCFPRPEKGTVSEAEAADCPVITSTHKTGIARRDGKETDGSRPCRKLKRKAGGCGAPDRNHPVAAPGCNQASVRRKAEPGDLPCRPTGRFPGLPGRKRVCPAVRQVPYKLLPEDTVVSPRQPSCGFERLHCFNGKGERGERYEEPEVAPLTIAGQAAHHDIPLIVRPVAGMAGDTLEGKRTGEEGA